MIKLERAEKKRFRWPTDVTDFFPFTVDNRQRFSMSNVDRLRLVLLLSLLIALPNVGRAQEREYVAIIPTFHDRLNTSGQESFLQLQRERFIVFVYRNAVAVYSEANFVNSGMETLTQEFALPSTGHRENGDEPGSRISNGILSAQVWVEGKQVSPVLVHDDNGDWYTIKSQFTPWGRQTVKAVFWAQTSLTDIDSLPGLDSTAIPTGKRGFLLDLYHAGVWNNAIETIDVTVVLRGSMSFRQDLFSAEPETYDLQDSTMRWTFRNIEPAPEDNIIVSYTPSGSWGSGTNTMAKLSTYIVKQVYDKLIDYASQIEED